MQPFFDPAPVEAWQPPAESPVIRYDLFPVDADADGVVLSRVRALVGMDDVYVFSDSRYGPAIVLYSRLDDISPPGASLVLTLSVPSPVITLTLSPSARRGCNCGSRLRSFRPFQTPVRMAR